MRYHLDYNPGGANEYEQPGIDPEYRLYLDNERIVDFDGEPMEVPRLVLTDRTKLWITDKQGGVLEMWARHAWPGAATIDDSGRWHAHRRRWIAKVQEVLAWT